MYEIGFISLYLINVGLQFKNICEGQVQLCCSDYWDVNCVNWAVISFRILIF